MSLSKPAVYVRVVWPRSGHHAEAIEAIGRGLGALLAAQKYTEPHQSSVYAYHNRPSHEWTGYHFTLDATHEVEKSLAPESEPSGE